MLQTEATLSAIPSAHHHSSECHTFKVNNPRPVTLTSAVLKCSETSETSEGWFNITAPHFTSYSLPPGEWIIQSTWDCVTSRIISTLRRHAAFLYCRPTDPSVKFWKFAYEPHHPSYHHEKCQEKDILPAPVKEVYWRSLCSTTNKHGF